MRNRRGEIATILTLGALIIIGITAVISSFTVKDKKTTSSRASVTCESGYTRCGPISNSDCCYNATETCSNLQCVLKPTTAPANTIAPTQSDPNCITNDNECDGPDSTCCGSGYKCKKKRNTYNCSKSSSNPTVVPNTPIPTSGVVPTTGSSGGSQYGCNNKGGVPYKTDAMCSSYCKSTVGSDYVKNSQGIWLASDGGDGLHYCCCEEVASTGANGQPDDACSLIKCKDGEQTVVEYSPSLSQYGIPLSRCSGINSAEYGGILVLTSRAGNYSCNGNAVVETPIVVEEPPTPDPGGGECKPGTNQGDCASGFHFYKSGGGLCCPAGVSPPTIEPTDSIGAAECIGIQPLDRCNVVAYRTGGYPVRKKTGSEWYCCKTDSSTPPSQTPPAPIASTCKDPATHQSRECSFRCWDTTSKKSYYFDNKTTSTQYYRDDCSVLGSSADSKTLDTNLTKYCKCGSVTGEVRDVANDTVALNGRFWECVLIGTYTTKPQAEDMCAACNSVMNTILGHTNCAITKGYSTYCCNGAQN